MPKFKEGEEVRLIGSDYVGSIDRYGFTSSNGHRWDYRVNLSRAGMPIFIGMNEDELEKVGE